MTSPVQKHATTRERLMANQGLLDIVCRVFEQKIPFNSVLGLQVTSLDPIGSEVSFDMRPEMIGNFSRGILHGGVISTVLDTAGGLGAYLSVLEKHVDSGETQEELLARFTRIGTIDLRVDFLRPGAGKRFRASTVVLRTGSRVAVTRSDLFNEDNQLLASATAAYTV